MLSRSIIAVGRRSRFGISIYFFFDERDDEASSSTNRDEVCK
ncbi:hypothetical protein N9D08_01540 [bacterium]|nr:hypothetical protein [bacterium]